MPHRTHRNNGFLDSLEPVSRLEGVRYVNLNQNVPVADDKPPSVFTFLWFVICECLGLEDKDKGDGVFYWECIKCGDCLLHTFPHRPEQKDRWICFKCSNRRDFFWMGDSLDALKYLHHDRHVRDDFSMRRRAHEAMRQEYDRLFVNNQRRPVAPKPTASITSPRGSSSGELAVAISPQVRVILTAEEYQAVLKAADLCDLVSQDFSTLADACRRHQQR